MDVNQCEQNWVSNIPNPYKQDYSHLEGCGAKMNLFGKVSEQLMVEWLNPESISTLMVDMLAQPLL